MRLRNHIYLAMLFTLLLCLGSSTKIIVAKGVLDRIEDHDQAVLLLEMSDQTVIVPKSALPVGSQINMWFTIELIDQTYKVVSIDYKSTENNKQKSTHLMNELQKVKGE